jgi:bifunctional DNA-binding transcriptional regulator/antitoxin component of YhaV-PrlF toxin-antitoxin module
MNSTMYNLKISSQGQVSIPVDIMRKLGLKKGGYVRLKLDNTNTPIVTNKLAIDEFLGSFDGLVESGMVENIKKDREAQDRKSDRAFGLK